MIGAEWARVEWASRERAYRTIDNDPRVLFECDGGPVGVEAEVIMARLIGLDDQIVEDGMRLARVEPQLLVPIRQRFSLAETGPPVVHMPAAKYVLQSNYATVDLDGMYAPEGVELRSTFTFRVLYLRYKRRL